MQNHLKRLSQTKTLLFVIISIAGLLNFSVGLETLVSIVGFYKPAVVLDMLRLTGGFYIALACYIAIVLLPVGRLWATRILFCVIFVFIVSLLAHVAAVSVQLTSEAGTMSKVMFYSNYFGLNDYLFKILVLYIVPLSLILFLFVNFFYCLQGEPALKKKFSLGLIGMIFFLAQSMLGPMQVDLPKSLVYHPLMYLLKTGYFPKKDIYEYDQNARFQSLEIDIHAKPENQPNVVLIVLESFRNDISSLKQHNTDDEIMPFLNQLKVNNSLVFDNAFVTVPHTSKALVGIHCGILPFLDIPIYESKLGVPVKCLPDYLKELGFNTVYFQSPTEKYENRRELMQELGYQEIYSAESFKGSTASRTNLLGFEDKVMLSPSLAWLENSKSSSSPFLMTFLTGTTHRSYSPPEYFKKNYYNDSELKNNYINALRYTDLFLKELFENFKKVGAYENSIFIILSDHGEAFGEHGVNIHNNVAYNEVTQIFMMIHDPSGSLPSGHFKDAVSQAQVLPTIIDMLGYEFSIPENQLGSVFDDNGRAFSSCYEKLICTLFVEGATKYIYFFDEKKPELFLLNEDRLEHSNVSEAKPEIAAEMHGELMKWYNFHQSAYHNFYREKDSNYLSNYADMVIHTLFDMHRSLREIWPDDNETY